MKAQARSLGLSRLSALLHVNKLTKLSELPLSIAPYSMASSALADGLWSMIFSFFTIIFCLFRKKERGIYGGSLEQPLLNVRTHGTSQLASFFSKGVTSSSMRFLSYIYLTSSPHFSYFILVDLKRESSLLCLPCFRQLADPIAFAAVILLSSSLLKEPSTNWVSLFFYFILSFIFVS